MKFLQLLSMSLLVCFIQAASVSPASAEIQEDPVTRTGEMSAVAAAETDVIVRTPSKTMTGFAGPNYIQIVGNEVFLAMSGKIQVLDVHTGAKLRNFSLPSRSPHGLFVRGNRVLTTDVGEETYSFTLSGELYSVHYSPNARVVSVALDYNGLMYINEWFTCKINVYNIDGTKSHTLSAGKSCYLRKVQFDKQGNLYVGGHYSRAVFVFDRSGNLTRKIPLPTVSFMEGIHINPLDEDYLYVADRSGKVLKVEIATGKVVEKFSGLSGASDIAIAPDGKVWVVDMYGNSIKIYCNEK